MPEDLLIYKIPIFREPFQSAKYRQERLFCVSDRSAVNAKSRKTRRERARV